MGFFCLSADYFGTGKYKLEILQEGVVSKYKERLFFNSKYSHLPSQKVTKPLANQIRELTEYGLAASIQVV